MHLTNLEGHGEYNLRSDWWQNRAPGLSAMMRVRDEEEFIRPSILSVLDWCDEVIVALQCSTDRTEDIVQRLAEDTDKIRILHYPFESRSNGPGHDEGPSNSVFDRSYFYNWCLAQTRRSHVIKWDGDMVAMDWLGECLCAMIYRGERAVKIFGVDIVGPGLNIGQRKYCAAEPRLFRVDQSTYYAQGPNCEVLRGHQEPARIEEAGFLHFKWSKPFEKATAAWPADWRQKAHFRNIARRAHAVSPYTGEMPSVLQHA